MKKTLEKIRNNKALKTIGNILYVLIFVIVVFMLIVVALQRFTNNEISIGGYRIFSVASGSMVPKYEIGDILIAKEINVSDIQVGDNITYKGKLGGTKDKIVTHQVISIEQKSEIIAEENRQFFMYGFLLAKRLKMETE